MTLRGGDAVDGYAEPPEFDPAIDEPTDVYLETHAFGGLPYLDAASWRHYLPRLIDHALRHLGDPRGMVIDGVLFSLRPPDREPPRLAALTTEQEAVIVAFLEHLAFSEDVVPERNLALQVLEEWWIPNALYRRRPESDAQQAHPADSAPR
ncbi:MAG: hypothetical protein M1337_02395 [Actinobacteria bacterium]|nr:hypothetical protein [Actinomycetota bacterium]